MKTRRITLCMALLFSIVNMWAQKKPIMGWSSWNNFHVNISEQMIKGQADAMIASGLAKVGYQFVNIDDGYFGGRDSLGNLFTNAQKFPSSMSALVDYIHSKGLKAGIYSDGGENTCGSMWDEDKNGIGVGLYGHIDQDCDLFFRKWKFDFIKVDWCGGEKMKLNEEDTYLKIIQAVKSIDTNIVFNICRWQFPGIWAIKKADSWRISGDIRSEFKSIMHIIDLNTDLYQYASPGHYNDMDMLQVGRGMSYDEDKTHFSMWCMLNSPLLAGNDLRTMSKQTIEILSNKEIIDINQDIEYPQARKLYTKGNIEVWKKTLWGENTNAIAILNRGEKEESITLTAEQLGLSSKSQLRDLWQHQNKGRMGNMQTFIIPSHGILILKAKGK